MKPKRTHNTDGKRITLKDVDIDNQDQIYLLLFGISLPVLVVDEKSIGKYNIQVINSTLHTAGMIAILQNQCTCLLACYRIL